MYAFALAFMLLPRSTYGEVRRHPGEPWAAYQDRVRLVNRQRGMTAGDLYWMSNRTHHHRQK